MTVAEWLFIAATALCALAVMPGSLGVLALTNDLRQARAVPALSMAELARFSSVRLLF